MVWHPSMSDRPSCRHYTTRLTREHHATWPAFISVQILPGRTCTFIEHPLQKRHRFLIIFLTPLRQTTVDTDNKACDNGHTAVRQWLISYLTTWRAGRIRMSSVRRPCRSPKRTCHAAFCCRPSLSAPSTSCTYTMENKIAHVNFKMWQFSD